MFYALLLGLVSSVLGIGMPILLMGHKRAAYVAAAIAAAALALIFYRAMPSLVWPLGGGVGATAFVLGVGVLFICVMSRELGYKVRPLTREAIVVPVALVMLFAFRGCIGCGMFRADDYASLIGQVRQSEWTKDVQPADPKHIRLVPRELALFLADKQLAQAPGAIGSQFEVAKDYVTLQLVKGELWYVVPLDYNGFKSWTATDAVPGYIMVHGEDPTATPRLELQEKLVYTPGAFFSTNLERRLWTDGYLFKGLTDYSLEVDDGGRAWWVVTVFEPTVAFWGKTTSGVVVVDPATGTHRFHPHGDIPTWVDRVVPADFAKDWVEANGEYRGGWWNSVWSKKDLTKPEEPDIVYGSDDQPYWVMGITSTSSADEALVGLMYIHSRTGAATFYRAAGSTDAAVLTAVNNQVSYRRWHGASPVLYNLYGIMTAVVPLLGENNTFQGVALTRVDNLQTVFAEEADAALRQYQRIATGVGPTLAPEAAHQRTKVTATVGRVSAEVMDGRTVYYLLLTDRGGQFFTATSELSPALTLTRDGDEVEVEFVDSPEGVVPLTGFTNRAILLRASAAQADIARRAGERHAPPAPAPPPGPPAPAEQPAAR